MEVGYEHWLHQRVKFISNLNVGYGVSILEDYSSSLMPGGVSYNRSASIPPFTAVLVWGLGLLQVNILLFNSDTGTFTRMKCPPMLLELV